MAKIRRYKLSWDASDSKNVIGYMLYWAKGAEVGYDSKCLKVGISFGKLTAARI